MLAILLLDAGRVVPQHRVIDGIWADQAGENTANTLQVYVSNLRRVFQPDRPVVTRDGGYELQVVPGALDLDRYRTAADEGRRLLEQNRYTEAADRLSQALALWRGPALGDLRDEPFAAPEVAALDESRIATLEARITADLALGRAAQTVGELRALVDRYPLRERFRALLMEALYRAGWRSAALQAYRDAQVVLRDELGADPSPELQRMQGEILADAELSRVHRTARPFLLLMDGAGRQQVVALDADRSPFTIGRRAGNDLALGWDPEVSRDHARLERDEVGWSIVDVSRNGTFVGGAPVAGRRPLHDGEFLRIGRTVLVYRTADALPRSTADTDAITRDGRTIGPR